MRLRRVGGGTRSRGLGRTTIVKRTRPFCPDETLNNHRYGAHALNCEKSGAWNWMSWERQRALMLADSIANLVAVEPGGCGNGNVPIATER
jgi:hypothetical protein